MLNYVRFVYFILNFLFCLHFQQIEMKFNEPFFGLAYADFDRNSACQILGKGELSYRLDLPLKGCGTKQVSSIASLGLELAHGSVHVVWN